MDIYKKKPLKFNSEELRRILRHSETLGARESSRFERLSMIRDLNESDFTTEDMANSPKVTQKKPTSRLEMLFKWKQEKQLKKELDMRNKKKPFCVGRIKNVAASNDSPNKLSPKASLQRSRIINISKQVTIPKSIQSSRIPSNFKQTITVPKPNSCVKNTSSLPKTVAKVSNNSTTSKNQFGVIPRSTASNNTKSTINKPPVGGMKFAPCSKAVNQAASTKTVTAKHNFSGKAIPKTNSSLKPQKQVAATNAKPSLLTFQKLQKVPSIPKPNLLATQKLQKTTVANTIPKFSSGPKIQKEISHEKNVTTRKGFCFRKAATDNAKQQKDCINSSINKAEKVNGEKITEVEHLSESVTNITLNCDLSIIKSRTSFAPDNFKFMPPAGLNFMFDDDPFEALEQAKLKFLSRTSTPTQESKNSSLINPANSFSYSSFSVDPTSNEPIANNDDNTNFKDSDEPEHKKSILDTPNEILKIENSGTEHLKLADKPCLENAEDNLEVNMSEAEHVKSADRSYLESAENNLRVNNSKIEHIKPFKPVLENDAIDKTSDNHNAESVEKLFISSVANDTIESQKICNSESENMLNGENFNENQKFHNHETEIVNLLDQPVKNNDTDDNIKEDKCEAVSSDSFEELLVDTNSPFDIIDFSKINESFDEPVELMKLEDRVNTIDIPKGPERKVAPFKRVSFLKKLSTLNAIAEVEDCPTPSHFEKENENIVLTPRRSKRLSSRQQNMNILKELVFEESTPQSTPGTPRRSLRLQKRLEETNCKPQCKPEPRHSLRLIDLNTPEKVKNQQGAKTDLTFDFACLNLKDSENMDPSSSCLIDFENSPDVPQLLKSRKVSLLYTPEKLKKEARKSIRGDLISFSPK